MTRIIKLGRGMKTFNELKHDVEQLGVMFCKVAFQKGQKGTLKWYRREQVTQYFDEREKSIGVYIPDEIRQKILLTFMEHDAINYWSHYNDLCEIIIFCAKILKIDPDNRDVEIVGECAVDYLKYNCDLKDECISQFSGFKKVMETYKDVEFEKNSVEYTEFKNNLMVWKYKVLNNSFNLDDVLMPCLKQLSIGLRADCPYRQS